MRKVLFKFKFKLLYVTSQKATSYEFVLWSPFPHIQDSRWINNQLCSAVHKFLLFSANLLWIFAWVSRNILVMRIYSGVFNKLIHIEHCCKTSYISLHRDDVRDFRAEEQRFWCQNVMGFLNRRWLTVVSQKYYTSRMTNRAENELQECTIVAINVSEHISGKSMGLLLRE